MRTVPASILTAFRDGTFVGTRRPIARVTVQHPKMELRNYSLAASYSYKKNASITEITNGGGIDFKHHMKVNECYANYLFASGTSDQVIKHALATPKELPNVKSVTWSRSIDGDVADCTIVLMNTKPLEVGETLRKGELDQPGYYTYDRGGTAFSRQLWKYTPNEWFGMLVPDNIIRTYEGYGVDHGQPPEKDGHLVLTGVWMIDSVESTDTGSMTIKARDIGRILLDQMYYPPVVPKQFYDAGGWSNWDGFFPTDPPTTRLKVKGTASSNQYWIGDDQTNAVAGHYLKYAFDGDPSTYWLSIGNDRPSRRFAYEWVQCKVNNTSVGQVRFRTKKKGYTAYISVMVGGVWQGKGKINYHQDGIGRNGADIDYVKSTQVDTEDWVTVKFASIKKVQAVRVTLGNLQDFHFGTYHYRGGIRDVEVHGMATGGGKTNSKYKPGPIGANPNKYYDYTDIVKLICAWAGFFWPSHAQVRYSDGNYHVLRPKKPDTRVLGKGVQGAVWGDFQRSGTSGPAELDASNFDKQSLMDCIAYIRDILGFVFFIDETGGVQWRLPNVFNYGCVRSTMSPKPGYIKKYAHPLLETQTLMSLQSTVDSKNVRESLFVGDVEGKIGAYAPGFNPNPTGIRRIGGWTDQNFGNNPEGDSKDPAGKGATKQAQLMADMISLRGLFTYRTDTVRIPANPAIQIDDQVRIYERVTAEGYVHYVKGIQSTLDMSTGEWTYDLQTHWLGYDKQHAKWVFDPKQLRKVTQVYLDEATKLAGLNDNPRTET